MNIIHAMILGLIQGLTEFLPVSSSGHLILFKKLFNMDTEQFGLSFDIALHAATLVAVFIVLWPDILALLKKPFQRLTLLLVIATIPAGIVGIFFDDYIERISVTGGFLGIAFLVTALLLFITDYAGKHEKTMTVSGKSMTAMDSLWIGIAQGLAVMPGISRSGSSLSAGLISGLKREDATKFAFLMSIPVVLGSTFMGVVGVVEQPEEPDIVALIVGMLVAFISGYIAAKFMLGFVKRHSLKGFGIYVGILGVLVLIDQLFFNKFFDVFLM